MLLAQCALLVGYFADQSWKKKLPHDDTGEAHKVHLASVNHRHWLHRGPFQSAQHSAAGYYAPAGQVAVHLSCSPSVMQRTVALYQAFDRHATCNRYCYPISCTADACTALVDRAVCGKRLGGHQVGCPWGIHHSDTECPVGVLAHVRAKGRTRGCGKVVKLTRI